MQWPSRYQNSETSKYYQPHHEAERSAIESDSPRYILLKGGEGGGKSVAGIVKGLNRLKRGMSGIMVSPDFQHFKKSLWPEFRRWCPWNMVVSSQQRRSSKEWEPNEPFTMNFINGASVLCGGIDDPASWEGPNINWAHLDEGRKKKDASALKVLDGRIRIPGPKGESPQLWITTTPAKNWLYDYFGPAQENDPYLSFKGDSLVVTLLTIDNELMGNLSEGFTSDRSQSLTESEIRVNLNAEWEDIADAEFFLPDMTLWDNCRESLPPLARNEPMIVALDAATGRADSPSDCFGMIGVTRHPQRHNDAAIRLVMKWQAKSGRKIDFDGTDDYPGPIRMLRQWLKTYNIIQVAYDPTELRYVAQQMQGEVWFEEIPQGTGSDKRPGRGMFDKQWYDLILQKRVAHDGNPDLREHVKNSNRKIDSEDKRMRIVKRSESLKIDLNIAACMGACEILRLDL